YSNVMLRFMVQAFQDPPLCSSTETKDDEKKNGPDPNGVGLKRGRSSKLGYMKYMYKERGRFKE
ncbi:MAG: hypothetical protein ACK559_14025, partial [bacterium]